MSSISLSDVNKINSEDKDTKDFPSLAEKKARLNAEANQREGNTSSGTVTNYMLPSGLNVSCKMRHFYDPGLETIVYHNNVRPPEDTEDTSDLDESILSNGGNKTPVLARYHNGQYEVIAGSRRRASVIKVGKPLLAIVLDDVSDNDATMLSTIENIGRKDLDPFLRVESYLLLLAGNNPICRSQGALAKRTGHGRTYIARVLRASHVPRDIYLKFKDRQKITLAAAIKLGELCKRLTSSDSQKLLAHFHSTPRINFDECVSFVNKLLGKKSNDDNGDKEVSRVGTSSIVSREGKTYLVQNKNMTGILFNLPNDIDLTKLDIKKVNSQLEAVLTTHLKNCE